MRPEFLVMLVWYFLDFFIAYGSIHQGHKQFSDDKRQEIVYRCLDAFQC